MNKARPADQPTSRSSPPSAGGRVRRWVAGGFSLLPVSNWEWFWMRLFTSLIVLHSLADWHPFKYSGQPVPVGIARWVDLSFLYQPDLAVIGPYQISLALAIIGSLGYLSGRGLLLWLPLLTFLHTAVRTYANSQGFTHHGQQLISMILLCQTVVLIWHHWRSRQAMRHADLPAPLALASYMEFYCRGLVAFSYVASALTKLINSKGLWLYRSKYTCIELIKSHRLAYYSRLDETHLAPPVAAEWLLQHPFAAQLLFGSGFILEAAAFVALRDRAWALFIGISLIAMHQGIDWLMKLQFRYHEALILVFLIQVPFWLGRALGRRQSLTA